MQDESVILKIDQTIATLTLNRPLVRNAFDDTVIQLLTEHLYAISENEEIQVVILRGEGDHFSAGADIQWMKKMAVTPKDENRKDALKLSQLMYSLYYLNKPIIALVQGSVFGGAMGLIAASDIVIADPNTIFCLSEVKLGLVAAVAGPYVVKAMGARLARRYMLTAETFSAEKAKALNLVHEIVPEKDLSIFLERLINILKSNGPKALATTKHLLHTLVDEPHSLQSQLAFTADLIAEVRSSPEAKEGLSAFLEKRKPFWQEV